jgi:hypothetical protein
MKKNDFVLIGIVLSVAVASFFFISGENAELARISVDGKLYATISLDKSQRIEINDTNVAVVENGEIYMESATCPDKLCVHQGRISDSSKKIVCLPNKVIIEATKESSIDSVVR